MNLEQIARNAGQDLMNVTTTTIDTEARLAELLLLRRRRATARALVAAVLVVAVVVAAGSWLLGFGIGGVDRTPPVAPDTPLDPTTEQLTTVSYCVAPSYLPSEDTLHVDGQVVHTPCKWRWDHRVHVWYHAGRTIIESEADSSVYLVSGGDLVRLGVGTAARISDDGRYVLWLSKGVMVYDLQDARLIRETPRPTDLAGDFSGAAGIDRLGRAYFGPIAGRFWMYDITGDRWAELQDILGSPGGSLSYLIPDGFAVPAGDGTSVEGQVTTEGRFVPVRPTPLAWASWSQDRSRLVTSTVLPVGVSGSLDPSPLPASGTIEVWAQPADDFDARTALRVPLDGTDPWRVSAVHWESNSWVLLTFVQGSADAADPDTATNFRCSVDSGTCSRLDGILLPIPVWGMTGG
jgi:hypothetical protein